MPADRRRQHRRGWTILIIPDQGAPRPLRFGWGILIVAAVVGVGLGIGAVGAPLLLAGSVSTNMVLLSERASLQGQTGKLSRQVDDQRRDFEKQLQDQQRDYERRLNLEQTKVQSLTRKARNVTVQLSELQERVRLIASRAGIGSVQRTSSGAPRGGPDLEITDPDALYEALQSELGSTETSLGRALGPLESQLRREAAVPAGWPAYGAITSRFGTRIGPRTGRFERHTGWDIAAGYGTPVAATAPGTVVEAGWTTVGYGLHVVVDHGYGYRTLFGHLSSLGVSVGDRVNIGQILGRIGSTGNSTGPHLHYEVRIGGQPVNPGPFLYKARKSYPLGNLDRKR